MQIITKRNIARIIRRAIILAEEHQKNNGAVGLCKLLIDATLLEVFDDGVDAKNISINHPRVYKEVRNILYFPNYICSIYKHKPEGEDWLFYWFDPEDIEIRIKILKETLKELENDSNSNS